ncbi:hypothetical protein O9G_005200 [Rozella allomycis CSF55]|uniref:Uncharacterized protein n=1 Tax=Rozella allomycis (strain CSF55) TaxID=988480 RepID=A0A075AN55_ROZAC|nr:hypothetical protein O9G_005200 [Rozella allomycis CSF55]|eukprot:EPZ31230.1 hypothetical protein O9G_005200 [Rozella allomycis CSF55]
MLPALFTFRVFKYILLSGLLLIGGGITGLAVQDDRTGVATQSIFGGLIGIGFLACIISTLGIVAAVKEHIKSLKIVNLYALNFKFFGLLCAIFLIQVIIGSVALSRASDIERAVEQVWKASIKLAVPTDCSTDANFGFQRPCMLVMKQQVFSHLDAIGSVAITMAFFQVLGLAASAVLFIKLQKEAVLGADAFAAGGKYMGGI